MNRLNKPKTIPNEPTTTTWGSLRPLLGALGPSWDDLWGILGRSWELAGPLGTILVGSWALLGRPWGVLGCSWRPRSPLGTVLAAIFGQTNRKTENKTVQDKSIRFLSILEPNMTPKTTRKRPQTESKLKTKNHFFSVSWTRLGPTLR